MTAKVVMVLGTTSGAGMKPPSLPIMIQSGPLVAGSGMPLGQSAYWFGAPATGTILTSVQLPTGTAASPSQSTVPVVPGVGGVVLSAAT